MTARVVLVVVWGWAGASSSPDRPEVAARPGEYATLAFPLRGDGVYDYSVEAAEPWSPLANRGSVRLDGEGFVSVTVRVPSTVPAGEVARIAVAFQNRDVPSDRFEAAGTVRVLTSVEVELVAPRSLEGEVDESLVVPVTVRNAGNVRDTVTVEVASGMWAPRVPERRLELDPGAAREVDVDLVPQGRVSDGFRQYVRITGRSEVDPDVESRILVEARFFASGARAADGDPATAAPELTVSLRAGLQGALEIDSGGVRGRVDYVVEPGLEGELSDYVEGDASIGRLAGSFIDPFETVPSRLDAGLRADAWDARVTAGAGGYGLSAGSLVADERWRIGGSGRYRPTEEDWAAELGAYAYSQDPDLDLQLYGRTQRRDEARTDTLGARFRTRLREGVTLRTGARLLGTQERGYGLDLGLDQSLSWQTQDFDLTQSYSGTPTAGLHTIGANGGLRAVEPFGVRASTSLRLEPGAHQWRSSLVLTARPVGGVGLSVRGTYSTGSTQASWRVRSGASYRTRIGPVRTRLRARYAYTGAIRGDVASESRYEVGADASLGAWRLATSGSYHVSDGGPDEGDSRGWNVEAATGFAPTRTTRLEAEFEHERLYGDERSSSTSFEAGWRETWMDGIRTELLLERSVDGAPDLREVDDRVAVAVNLEDLGVDGLRFAAGYALTVDGGALSGDGALAHELRGSVSYALALPFETPATVVDAFGGRRGGAVTGVAYIDSDLDGRRDADERAMADMRIELGGVQSRTDVEGRYDLRVPSGRHAWTFGPGVPPRVKSAVADAVTVEDDAVLTIDLPFVPVASLDVTLFDDVDSDGQRSADESGIAFGGVRITGPETRSIRVDGRGNATVTGLVPGSYRVTPDPERLPPRYRATTPEREVVLREGDRPPPVVVGAGEPPKRVVTTYSGGTLAVMVRTDGRPAPAGGDVAVTALVSGEADAVGASVGGHEITLERDDSRWTGTLRIPRDTPLGTAEIVVTAKAGEQTASATADVPIVDRPLVEPTSLRVLEGEARELEVETAFGAGSVELVFGTHVVSLASDDGRRWEGTLAVSELDGLPAEGRYVVDGEAIGSVVIELAGEGP